MVCQHFLSYSDSFFSARLHELFALPLSPSLSPSLSRALSLSVSLSFYLSPPSPVEVRSVVRRELSELVRVAPVPAARPSRERSESRPLVVPPGFRLVLLLVFDEFGEDRSEVGLQLVLLGGLANLEEVLLQQDGLEVLRREKESRRKGRRLGSVNQ